MTKKLAWTNWACTALLLLLLPAGSSWAATPDASWDAIRLALREGRYDGAIADLNARVAADPRDREAFYYLALIHWRLGHDRSAAQSYRRVLALDPTGPMGADARAWLLAYEARPAASATTPRPQPAQTPKPLAPAAGAITPRPPAIAPVAPTTALPAGELAEPPMGVSSVPSQPPSRASSPGMPPAPSRSPTPSPVASRPAPIVRVTPKVQRSPAARPVAPERAPWLMANPEDRGGRSRSANPHRGYFKVADGSLEFRPPAGFFLLDEGVRGGEFHVLFGPPDRRVAQPPTLLVTWRELPGLRQLAPAQRGAKAHQLLVAEAANYGPRALEEKRFGTACLRVRQREGAWAADTWLFVRYNRLYAMTYGGDATRLERYRARVEAACKTPIFYP